MPLGLNLNIIELGLSQSTFPAYPNAHSGGVTHTPKNIATTKTVGGNSIKLVSGSCRSNREFSRSNVDDAEICDVVFDFCIGLGARSGDYESTSQPY